VVEPAGSSDLTIIGREAVGFFAIRHGTSVTFDICPAATT
jgi:hypothetical protein